MTASRQQRPPVMPPVAGSMAAELREAPAAVQRQAQQIAAPLNELAARLVSRPPGVVVTCARGSSAHAATFAKHLIERYLGIPVAAAAPNIATVYGRRLQLDGQLFLAISQSGSSDDLVEMTAAARTAGAVTAAIVNDLASPLAVACDLVLPMAAGAEQSVAATKTFIASLAAVLRLTAQWSGRPDLASACERLPARLTRAAQLDWSEGLLPLAAAASLVTIGRGPTLAIAREAALKFKETCALQAEAFSSAEFRHGPIALVARGYPVLVLAPNDESAADSPDWPQICAAPALACWSPSLARPNRAGCRRCRPISPTPTRFALFKRFMHFSFASPTGAVPTSNVRATCAR